MATKRTCSQSNCSASSATSVSCGDVNAARAVVAPSSAYNEERFERGLAMLRALSNSTHDVVSGVAVAGIRAEQFVVSSRVRFRELSEAEMAWYWETGEPADKAGSYGLQGIGSAFVASIEGSYSNVIGLPLVETVAALRKSGIECLGVSGQ